jgi:hypothetical protein
MERLSRRYAHILALPGALPVPLHASPKDRRRPAALSARRILSALHEARP